MFRRVGSPGVSLIGVRGEDKQKRAASGPAKVESSPLISSLFGELGDG